MLGGGGGGGGLNLCNKLASCQYLLWNVVVIIASHTNTHFIFPLCKCTTRLLKYTVDIDPFAVANQFCFLWPLHQLFISCKPDSERLCKNNIVLWCIVIYAPCPNPSPEFAVVFVVLLALKTGILDLMS